MHRNASREPHARRVLAADECVATLYFSDAESFDARTRQATFGTVHGQTIKALFPHDAAMRYPHADYRRASDIMPAILEHVSAVSGGV